MKIEFLFLQTSKNCSFTAFSNKNMYFTYTNRFLNISLYFVQNLLGHLVVVLC